MATVTMNVRLREDTGKGVARKLRAAGEVPAVLYGMSKDAVSLSVNEKDVQLALGTPAGVRAVLKLEVESGEKGAMAIFREIQRHPVSHDFLHIDLLAIDLTKTIDVSVPIQPIGTPVGVTMDNGVLGWSRREITIRVLPDKIPEFLELDISELVVNQTLHISDVPAQGFEILDAEDVTICSVSSTRIIAEDEDEDAEGEGEGEGAEGEAAAEPEAREE